MHLCCVEEIGECRFGSGEILECDLKWAECIFDCILFDRTCKTFGIKDDCTEEGPGLLVFKSGLTNNLFGSIGDKFPPGNLLPFRIMIRYPSKAEFAIPHLAETRQLEKIQCDRGVGVEIVVGTDIEAEIG